MPEGTTSSPLVEPDVRITLIRLSQKRSVENMRRQLHGVSFRGTAGPSACSARRG